MIFVLDNYDSFTYNLVHLLGTLGAEMVVERAEKNHVRDIFGFDRLKSRTYTTAQIDRMWTVAMFEDFINWFNTDPRAEEDRHLHWEEELEEARKAEKEAESNKVRL